MPKSLVQRQFGTHAAAYSTSSVHAAGESLARLVALAAPQPHWQGLDIATGAGHMAAAFAPLVATMIASDITDEMLAETARLAAARGLANMTTARADAGAIPYEDETFDLVCSRLAAHHFPDNAKFVSEAWRVLKRGGTFALVDNVSPDHSTLPDASDAGLAEAGQAYNAFEALRDPSHNRALTPEEWNSLLTAQGFVITAREQFGKELDFDSWVTRMGCDAATVTRLQETLDAGPNDLRRFLQPRRDAQGRLYFTLQELLLVAVKPA